MPHLPVGCSGSIAPGTQIFTNNLRLSGLLIRKPGIKFTAKIHSKSEENINVPATKTEKPIKKESINEAYEKQICFIGHSCTWLPTNIKTIKSEDIAGNIEKKILFLGHSCTWLPKSTSPSLLKSTLVEPSLVVQSDVKPKNTNIINEQESLEITNTVKSNFKVNSSTSPKNDAPLKIESVNLEESVIKKKQAIKEANDEDSCSKVNKMTSLKQSKKNFASPTVSELIQKKSQKDINLKNAANKSVQNIDGSVAIDEKVNELKTNSSISSDIYSNELESDSSTEQINKLLENSNIKSINSQSVKIIESTVVMDKITKMLKIIPTAELINMSEAESFERNSIKKNMAIMGGNSAPRISYAKPSVQMKSNYSEDKINKNVDDIAISDEKDISQAPKNLDILQAQKNVEISSKLISKKELNDCYDNTKSLSDVTLQKSSNKTEIKKQSAIPEIHNETKSNSTNDIKPKFNKTVNPINTIKIVSDQKTDIVKNKRSELKSSTTNLVSAPKKSTDNTQLVAGSDYKKDNHNKSAKDIYSKKVEIKNEKDTKVSIESPQNGRLTKSKWIENVFNNNQDKNPKQITESISLNSSNPRNTNKVNKCDQALIEGNDKIPSSVNKTMKSEKNLVFMGHSCAWIPEDFGITPSAETLVENIEVKEKEVNKFPINQYSEEFMKKIKNIPDSRSLRKEKQNPAKENYSKRNPAEISLNTSKRNIVFMGHSCVWMPENIAKIELNTTRIKNDSVISKKQLNNEKNIKPKLSSILQGSKKNESNTKPLRKILNENDQDKTNVLQGSKKNEYNTKASKKILNENDQVKINKDTKNKKSSTQIVDKPIEVLFNSKLNINTISKKASKSNESLPIVRRNCMKEINSTKSADAILTKPPVKPNIGYYVFQDFETAGDVSTMNNISMETGIANENNGNAKNLTESDPMKNIYTKNSEQMGTNFKSVDGFVLQNENKKQYNNNKQSAEQKNVANSSKNVAFILIEEISKDNLKKIGSKEILKKSDNESNMTNLIEKKSLKQMELPLKGISSKEVTKSKKDETKLGTGSGFVLKKDKNSDIIAEKMNKVVSKKLETPIKTEQTKIQHCVDNKKVSRNETKNSFNKIQSNKFPSTDVNSKAIINCKPSLQKPDIQNPSIDGRTQIHNKRFNKIVKIGPVKKLKVFKTRSNIPISKSKSDRYGSGKYTEQSVNETIILASIKEGDSVKKRGRSYRAFRLKSGTVPVNKIQQTDCSENMEIEHLNAMEKLKKRKIDSSNTFSSTIMKKIESCIPIDSSSKEKSANSQNRGSKIVDKYSAVNQAYKDEQIIKSSSNESNVKEKVSNAPSIVTSTNNRVIEVADDKLNKSMETYIKTKNVTDKIFESVKISASESTNIPKAAKKMSMDTGFVLVYEHKNQNIDNTKKSTVTDQVKNTYAKTTDQMETNIEHKTASDNIIDSLKTSTSETPNNPESVKTNSLETGFVLVNEHEYQNINNTKKSTEKASVKNDYSKTCEQLETNYKTEIASDKISSEKYVNDLNEVEIIGNSNSEILRDEYAKKILKEHKIDHYGSEPSFEIKSNVTEKLANIKSEGSTIEEGTDAFNKSTNNKPTTKVQNNKETEMTTEVNAMNILKSLKIDNLDEWKTKSSNASKHEPSKFISKKEIKSEIVTEQNLSGKVGNCKDRDELDNAVTKSETKPAILIPIKDPSTSKMESKCSIPIKQVVTSKIENIPTKVSSRNRNKSSAATIKSKNDKKNIVLSPAESVSVEAKVKPYELNSTNNDKELVNSYANDPKKSDVMVDSLFDENAMKKLQKHNSFSFNATISADSDTVKNSIPNESNGRSEIQSEINVQTAGINLAHNNTEPETHSKNETVLLKPINLKATTRPKQREVDIFMLWKTKKEEALKLSNTPIKFNENIIDKKEEKLEEHKSPFEIDTIVKENLENTASKLGISKLTTETKECRIPNFNGTEKLNEFQKLSNPKLVVYSSNNLKFSPSKWEKVSSSKENNSIKENIPILKKEPSGSKVETVVEIISPFKKYVSNNLKSSATKLESIPTSNENNTVESDPILKKEISGKEEENEIIIKSPLVKNTSSNFEYTFRNLKSTASKKNSVENDCKEKIIKSPLEKYSISFDIKLKRIQDDLDKDCLNIKPEIKPHKNKEISHTKAENLADQNTIEKTRRKFQNILSSKENIAVSQSKTNPTDPISIPNKTDLISNEVTQNKLESTELKELKKSYIPLSFSITSTINKKSEKDPIFDEYKKYIIEGTTSAQKTNQVNSTNSKTPISNNSESLFQQLKNMIKEDLFTYPKEAEKEIKLNNKTEPKSKLSVESCAAQPSIDSTIKPESILKQVKNLIKEELFVVPENVQGTEKLNSNTGLTLERAQINENETKKIVPDVKVLPVKKSDTNLISVESNVNKDTSVINLAQTDSKNKLKETTISSKTNKTEQSNKQAETSVTKIAQTYSKNESKDSIMSSEINIIQTPILKETLLMQAKNTLIETTSLRAPIMEKSDQIISPRNGYSKLQNKTGGVGQLQGISILPESLLDESKPSISTSPGQLNIKDSNRISVTSKASKEVKNRKEEYDQFIEEPFSGGIDVPLNLSRKEHERMTSNKSKQMIQNSEIELKPWGETVSHPATIMNKIKAFFKDDNFAISKMKTGIFESSAGSSTVNDTKVIKEYSNNQNLKGETDISLDKSDHNSVSEDIRKFTTESLLKYKTENLKSALTKELSTDDLLNKSNSQNSNTKANLTFNIVDAKKSLNMKKTENFEKSNNITVDESSSSIKHDDGSTKDTVSQMNFGMEDSSSTKSLFEKMTDYFHNKSQKSVSISNNQEQLEAKSPEIDSSIEKISLLDHLTNINTEQIKYDNNIKLLAESKLDVKTQPENITSKMQNIVKTSAGNMSKSNEEKVIVKDEVRENIHEKTKNKSAENINISQDDTLKFLDMIGVTKSDDNRNLKIEANSKDSTILASDHNLKVHKYFKKPEEMIKTEAAQSSLPTKTTDNILKTTKINTPKSLESFISSLDMTIGVTKSNDTKSYKIEANYEASLSSDIVSKNVKKLEEMTKTDAEKSSQSSETTDNISKTATNTIKTQIMEPSVALLAMTEITNSNNTITSKIETNSKDLNKVVPDNVLKTDKYLKKSKEIIKTDAAKLDKSTETIDNFRKISEIMKPKSLESFVSSLDMTVGVSKSENSRSYKIETTSKDSTKLIPNNDLKNDKYLNKSEKMTKTNDAKSSLSTEITDNISNTTKMIKSNILEPVVKDLTPLVPDNSLETENYLKKLEKNVKTDAAKSSQSTENKDNILKTTKIIKPKVLESSVYGSHMKEVPKSDDSTSYNIKATSKDATTLSSNIASKTDKYLKKLEEMTKQNAGKSSESTKATKSLKELEEITKTEAARSSKSTKSTNYLNTTKMIKLKILDSIVWFSDKNEVTKSDDSKSYKIAATSKDSTQLISDNALKTDNYLKKPEEIIKTDSEEPTNLESIISFSDVVGLSKPDNDKYLTIEDMIKPATVKSKTDILNTTKMIKPKKLESIVCLSDMNKSDDKTSYKIDAISDDSTTLSTDIGSKTNKYLKKREEMITKDLQISNDSSETKDNILKTTKMIKPKILKSSVPVLDVNEASEEPEDSATLSLDTASKTDKYLKKLEEMTKTNDAKLNQSTVTTDNISKTTNMIKPKILESSVSFSNMNEGSGSTSYQIEATSKDSAEKMIKTDFKKSNQSPEDNILKSTKMRKPNILESVVVFSDRRGLSKSASDNALETDKYLTTEDMIKPVTAKSETHILNTTKAIKSKSLSNNSTQYEINLEKVISPKSQKSSETVIDEVNQNRSNEKHKIQLTENNDQNIKSVSKNENDSSIAKSSDQKKSSKNQTRTNSSKTTADGKPSVLNFTSVESTSSNNIKTDLQSSDYGATTSIELDRYNSFEATPFNKNEIVVKILNALKLASIKKD